MANRYISTLSAVRKEDINKVGRKGANLGELAGKGFPVPSGFVVSAEAYSLFFASLRLQKVLRSLHKAKKEELSRACGVICNTITNASFPDELAESILAAHEQIVGDRAEETLCAVRSSATTDDLAETSFAGQHATYYYVERANLLRMIQYCWASLWSKEAVSFRNACGLEHSAAMAVVIQEMVCSEISGSTFTANPITEADEIVIEAAWGMGAAIVDGRVTPDRYTLDPDTLQVLDQRIAEKNVMVPAKLRAESSSRLTEVPPALQQQETLSPDLLKTVAAWALKVEKHFGSPQNIEWAIADERLYILQSRPISSVGHQSRQPEPAGQYVLFKSICSNRPTEPLTPLTAHLISLAVFPVLRPILGHCYLDLKYIRPFYPFSLSDQELVDFLSLSTLNDSLLLQRFSFRKLPVALFFWFCGYLLFGVFWARSRNISKNIWIKDAAPFHSIEKNESNNPLGSLLRLSLLPKIFDPIGAIPLWMNISSVRHPIPFLVLRALIQRWLPQRRSEVFSLLGVKDTGCPSLGLHAAFEQLVLKAGQFPAIRDQFLNRPSDQVMDALQKNPNARPFLRLFAGFMKKYGYRTAKGLELQSARWEEHPNHVVRLIRERLRSPVEEEQQLEPSAKKRADLLKRIKGELAVFPWEQLLHLRWYLLLFLAHASKRGFRLGENSRSYHLMAMATVRKKLLTLEKEFMEQGALRCKGDIFFLKLHEITQIQQGLLYWPDIEERIHQRRHAFIRATRKTPARALGVDLPRNRSKQPDGVKRSNVILPGQTASPGSYTGRARVIMDLAEGEKLCPGEILVAPYTDSSWTPFFLSAGGAVVEVGSYLSHAGTAAREYSLPCIVDVAGCTGQIQNGDLLWINGEKGEVQILESGKQAKQDNGETR
jgi:pyruvate,water dikinase